MRARRPVHQGIPDAGGNHRVARLFINDKQVGSLDDVQTQNGKFNLCGEGLNIGCDGGAPVTYDYPGERPWAIAGATIKQVIVDVSGEPYLDLEKEALAMMHRD